MILQIFTIHDQKANAFLPPWFLPLEPMAIRVFADCVNDPQHQFCKHPEDYTLFRLGTFNDENAEIKLENKPTSLYNGVTLIKQDLPHETTFCDETPILPDTQSGDPT